jgi:hypothetical protein
MRRKKQIRINDGKYSLVHDLFMIGIGVVFAIVIVKTGILDFVVDAFMDYYIVASFIAGVFFTSAFTIAPSSVALVHIANHAPIPGVVLFGALGAMCGDLILFFFIRDRFADDLINALKKKTVRRIFHSFHFGFLKWMAPVLGAIIIASPVPDEFAVTLFGMSKMRTVVLMPLTLIMNALGIYVLIEFSHLV